MQLADEVQVPQLILNYKTGSADGISLAFLTVWLIGDICNLSGMVTFFFSSYLHCLRSYYAPQIPPIHIVLREQGHTAKNRHVLN